MTTIATWNLHHMTQERAVPEGVTAVIRACAPDVLVLTEYVSRGKQASFEDALRGMGLNSIEISQGAPRQNQLLVASRFQHFKGGAAVPSICEAAATNFLHRYMPKLDLHVLGFRVPYYQAGEGKELAPYWKHLVAEAKALVGERCVLIGDFNIGNTTKDAAGNAAMKRLSGAGYRIIAAHGQLDRAMVSPKLRLRSFAWIEQSGALRLTGAGGLSDHPMLVIDIATQ
jgi:endonuclease/exonuclease/phosphatase family metal-dependent hydrolase